MVESQRFETPPPHETLSAELVKARFGELVGDTDISRLGRYQNGPLGINVIHTRLGRAVTVSAHGFPLAVGEFAFASDGAELSPAVPPESYTLYGAYGDGDVAKVSCEIYGDGEETLELSIPPLMYTPGKRGAPGIFSASEIQKVAATVGISLAPAN